MSIPGWWLRLETNIAEVPTWVWLVLAAAVLACAVWWWVPKWQMKTITKTITASNPKDLADIEDNFRKTVSQTLGGIAVLFGVVIAYMQLTEQRDATYMKLLELRDATQKQQNSAQKLLISNQIAKGFEQLGSKKLVVRLGGIYSLEGVMNESQEYHRSVEEALCAFVRVGTIGKEITDKSAPTTDIQAALRVIGRRHSGEDDINLTQVKISQADLTEAGLSKANLTDADLTNADLTGAHLIGTKLINADLSGANLTDADLSGATLSNAKNLTKDQLSQACGKPKPETLPDGLKLDKPCPQSKAPPQPINP